MRKKREKQPKVSIITPVHNAEKFIELTIKSVLNQTYDNWEMIIVDDKSTDNTIDIIRQYAEKDNRIYLYISKVNLGVADARNKCLELMTGRFIAYLDADDIWTEDKLEKQVDFMIENHYAFTNTDYEVIDENGNAKGKVVHMLKETDYHGFLQHNLLQTLGIMIDINIIPKELCRMRKECEREDAATWLQILKAGYSCYGLNQVLGQYRRVEGSRSSNKKKAILGMWNLYRKTEGLSLLYSCYYFVRYAIYAVWKRTYFFTKIRRKNENNTSNVYK